MSTFGDTFEDRRVHSSGLTSRSKPGSSLGELSGLGPKKVTVHDKMQRGYRYVLTAPTGRKFDPEFRPELTPKEMLALGVFCGKYMTDCQKEFPATWFARRRLSPSGRDCSLNYFGLDASQPLSVWRQKGWIHPDDPRGWFQWYCRYYMGRRMKPNGPGAWLQHIIVKRCSVVEHLSRGHRVHDRHCPPARRS